MDKTQWNTRQCLEGGILGRPIPESSVPIGFKGMHVSEGEWTKESLLSGLNSGGLTASMYYGCWDIWKDGDGFSGQLLQYRRVTESFWNVDIKHALYKAIDWATGCGG